MTESEFIERIDACLSRIGGLARPEAARRTIGVLRQNKNEDWKPWSDSAGIYYFVRGDEVVYVGRATPGVCIGNRVGRHLDSFGNPDWDEVIRDDETTVVALPFPPEDWHWLATLEVWLIDSPQRPKFNLRY